MIMNEYTLEDLSESSGLPIRTLRFYIQEGLLPGPDTRGKYATYSSEHLESLQLIVRLKDMHLPLKEIKQLLESMTADDITRILKYQQKLNLQNLPNVETQKPKNAVTDDALQYIKNLTKIHENIYDSHYPAERPQITPPKIMAQSKPAPAGIQEQWQRILLEEGVELHIRTSLYQEKHELVDELINYVKNLFRIRKDNRS